MPKSQQIEDRQRFTRRRVSIACRIEWAGKGFKGRVANISLGGALITDVEELPPIGNTVNVILEVSETAVKVQLKSRIIHTNRSGEGVSFGVEFEEPRQDVRLKLGPILKT